MCQQIKFFLSENKNLLSPLTLELIACNVVQNIHFSFLNFLSLFKTIFRISWFRIFRSSHFIFQINFRTPEWSLIYWKKNINFRFRLSFFFLNFVVCFVFYSSFKFHSTTLLHTQIARTEQSIAQFPIRILITKRT